MVAGRQDDESEYLIEQCKAIREDSSENQTLVLGCLRHENPLVREWAIVSSPFIGSRKKEILGILLDLVERDPHSNVRTYSFHYLTRMGYEPPLEMAQALISGAEDIKHKALILKSVSSISPSLEMLHYLSDSFVTEKHETLKKLYRASAVRVLNNMVILTAISKEEMKKTFPEVFEFSDEARLERIIKDERAKRSQVDMFGYDHETSAFSPEMPIKDLIEANYIHDVLEVNNKKIIDKTVYSRDIDKAKAYKRNKIECQICGVFGLELDVHHIIPLSSGGVDNEHNMIAICPNCHRMVHGTLFELLDNGKMKINFGDNILEIELNEKPVTRYRAIHALLYRRYQIP